MCGVWCGEGRLCGVGQNKLDKRKQGRTWVDLKKRTVRGTIKCSVVEGRSRGEGWGGEWTLRGRKRTIEEWFRR